MPPNSIFVIDINFSDFDICFRIQLYAVPHDLGKILEYIQVQVRGVVWPMPVSPSR